MTTKNIITPNLLNTFPDIVERIESKVKDTLSAKFIASTFENNVLTCYFE